jgi:hypothetical protein
MVDCTQSYLFNIIGGGDIKRCKMGIACVSGRAAKTIKFPSRLKKQPDKLPWPRFSSHDPEDKGPVVALGIDVVAKQQDIIKIVHKFFHVEDISMDELLQEVYVAIIHKNHTRSACDPRKSSFGHYVFIVANNVCINLVHKKKRYDKERDSIDAPTGDDTRTLLDTIEDSTKRIDCDETFDHIKEVEQILRERGMWEHARYVRIAMSGANPNVIREALSWGGRKISPKSIRDIRAQVQNIIHSMSLSS